jgi:hypothetical protein
LKNAAHERLSRTLPRISRIVTNGLCKFVKIREIRGHQMMVPLLMLPALLWAGHHKHHNSDESPVSPQSCPPEGRGGDPQLNRQKNRDSDPGRVETLDFAKFAALPVQRFAQKLPRRRWPEWLTKEVAGQEQRAVSLTGYVMEVKSEGAESANCGEPSLHDVHLSIAPAPDAPPAQWVVIEINPRLRERHGEWHLKRLKGLAKRHEKVRVSGWLMFDQEHLDKIGKRRLTAWEIHPVTKLEIQRLGLWIDF